MTQDGYDNLIRERDEILNVKIPKANEELKKAREQGDLSENSAYTAAREEREMLSQRLDEVNDFLKTATVAKPGTGVVGIGSIVTVDNGEKKITYKLVGEFESNPKESKISDKSPLGVLLSGKKTGDTVELKNDSGKTVYKIISVS